MSISAPDRKLLWARSGGFCAKCKRLLTEEVEGRQPFVVIGVEAHIVSTQPNGPRHRVLPLEERDAYDNLILLCPDDHVVVDKRPDAFTEEALRDLKRNHEDWAARQPGAFPKVLLRDAQSDSPLMVRKVTTGGELMTELGPAMSWLEDHPDPRSNEEADLLASFLTQIHDWSEIWDEVGPGEQVRIAFDLSKEIQDLKTAGFSLFAGRRARVLESGEVLPLKWREAIILIRRTSDIGDADSLQVGMKAPN